MSSGTYSLQNDLTNTSGTSCLSIYANDVVLDGNGFEVNDTGASSIHVVSVATNVTVQNVTATGGPVGVQFDGDDGTLQNVRASTSTTGVLVGGSNNTVTSVDASGVGGNGFTITGSNNTLSWNTANGVGASGFGVTGDWNLVVSSTATNAHNWGIIVSDSHDNTFKNVTVNHAGQDGVYIHDATNNTVDKIQARGSGDNAVDLLRAPGSTVDDSVVGDSPWGIYVSDSPDATVSDTVVDNTTFEHGISVGGSPETTVSNNTVTDTTDHGIIFASSDDSIVTENTVETVGQSGIYVGGEGQVVSENHVTGAVGSLDAGIYLASFTNGTVAGNTVIDSSAYSIKLDGSNNNTLNGNHITGSNYFGVEVYNSDDNLFYDNFLNSSSNAREASSNGNVWNVTEQPGTNVLNGSAVGGNYWAKPDRTGFSQTCTDADEDGFCDASYSTPYAGIDALPLVPTPDISVLPRSHDFGDVEVGSNATFDVRLNSTGLAPLAISGTSISGADADEFNVTSGGGSATIAPGDTRTVTVEFGPNTELPKSATLTVSSNDTDEPGIAVSLSGAGVITNHEPTVLSDEFVVYEGQTLSVGSPGLFVNDYDADGDSFTIVAIGYSPSNGTLSNVNGGGFDYTPDPDFTGTDSFSYSVKDPTGGQSRFATVTIEVRADSNSDPIIAPDSYSVAEGQTLSVSSPGLFVNDYDPYGENLDVVAVGSSPTNGSLGTIQNGGFTYTPDPGFYGTDSFTYSVADESGGQSEFETVTLLVHPDPNRDPVAVEDWLMTPKNTSLSLTDGAVLVNDYDPDGDTINFVAADSSQSRGTLIPLPGGGVEYQPETGFTGTDSFTYSIGDEKGGQSEFETVNVRVVDDTGTTPIAVEDRYTTGVNQTLSVSVPGRLANDYDPNDDSITTVAIGHSPSNGSLSNVNDGAFDYTPEPGFTGTDTFTYSIEDAGGSQSPFVMVTIEVTPDVNRGPEIVGDLYSTVENQTLSVNGPGLFANDFDPDGDALEVVAIGPSPTNGSLETIQNGGFTYTPDPGFVGTDSFSYSVEDTDGNQSSFEMVTVVVRPDSDKAPLAVDDRFEVNENETLTVSNPGAIQNDYDANGDSLTISALTSPSNGMLSIQNGGGFTYTPGSGFTGTDSFSYVNEQSDGTQSNWVTVTIDVIPNSSKMPSESSGSSETQEDDTGDTGNSDESSTDDSTNDGDNNGDGDISSGSDSSGTDDTGSSTPQLPEIPVVNTTGTAQTDVRSDNESLELNVTDISDGDTIDVHLPDQTVDDDFDEHGGALEGIETRFEGNGKFDMNVSYSPTPPGGDEEQSPPGGGLGYITIDHDASDDIVEEVAFTFRVNSSLMAEQGVDPSDAVLYRYHDGEWTSLETELVETGDGFYRFRSLSPGLSVFAIGVRGDDASGESQSSTDDGATNAASDTSPNQATTTTTDDSLTTETPTAEDVQTTETKAPGFGVFLSLVAVLAVASLASRRV